MKKGTHTQLVVAIIRPMLSCLAVLTALIHPPLAARAASAVTAPAALNSAEVIDMTTGTINFAYFQSCGGDFGDGGDGGDGCRYYGGCYFTGCGPIC